MKSGLSQLDLSYNQSNNPKQNEVNQLPFFLIPLQNKVRGQVQQMIQKSELKWRTIQKYQEQPFQSIGKYFRNVQYVDKNTRTVEALIGTLKYIYAKHVPTIQTLFDLNKTVVNLVTTPEKIEQKEAQKQHLNNEQKINKNNKYQLFNLQSQRQFLLSFIQQRIKAIRVQYYVQGIIYPNELIKIIRLNFMIQVLRETTITLQGLNQLLSVFEEKQQLYINLNQQQQPQQELEVDQNQSQLNLILQKRKNYLKQKFKHIYIQALQYIIVLTEKSFLNELINKHSIILIEQKLKETIKMKKAIQNSNYYVYQQNLSSHQNPIVRLLLWTKIGQMRDVIIQKIHKSKMNVKKTWLYKLMGFQCKKNDQNIWLDGKTILDEMSEENVKKNKKIKNEVFVWASIKETINFLAINFDEINQ